MNVYVLLYMLPGIEPLHILRSCNIEESLNTEVCHKIFCKPNDKMIGHILLLKELC